MKKHRVPDILIEQLLLGELPEARARQLREDPQVRARIAELQASNREILERYPPEVMVKRIGWRLENLEKAKQARARARPTRPWSLPRLAPAAGFAVLLLAAGAVLVTVAPWRERGQSVRPKGYPHLVIYRKTDGGAEELAAGGGIRAGDVLQIGYLAAERYGVIFSIDGRGVLTLHFPASPGAPSLLQPEGQGMLDYAYKLDDAPGFERFFLVSSNRPVPVAEVLAAGRRLASDPRQARQGRLQGLPAGLEQWSVLLDKSP
jgi:hypothetical protein